MNDFFSGGFTGRQQEERKVMCANSADENNNRYKSMMDKAKKAIPGTIMEKAVERHLLSWKVVYMESMIVNKLKEEDV